MSAESNDAESELMTPVEQAASKRCLLASDEVLVALSNALVVDGSLSKRECLATLATAMGKFMAITTKPDATEQQLLEDLWQPLQGIAFEAFALHRKQKAGGG
jgi:hypothetical protein